jgi:hypothetical protein
MGSPRDGVAASRFVQSVAAAYGAATMLTDAALAGGAGLAEARVVPPDTLATGGDGVDLVVSFDALGGTLGEGTAWQDYLVALGRRAQKALLVFVRNAERPGQGDSPDTTALARVLWQVGRVREHVYLGLPRWVAGSGVVHVPVGVVVRRMARFHGFVVDTIPRTPQARRRLRVAASS